MADVFISYTKEDRAAAQRVASWLADEGLSAWWDTSLLAGDSWSDVIRAELRDARCIVVLWSKLSWSSRWVQAEAYSGFERDCLVSMVLDDVSLEAPFNTIQAICLSEGKNGLLAGVHKKLGQTAHDASVGRPITKRKTFSRRAIFAVGGGALTIGALSAAALVARPHLPRWFPHATVTAQGGANGLRGLRVRKTLQALPALRMHFALDASRLYSTSTNEAQLWDVSTGALLAHWPLGSLHQGDAPLSPDESRLVHASSSDIAVVRNVASGEVLKELRGHTANVTTASFDATGSRIVTTSDDRSVRLWDSTTGEQIRVLRERWGIDGNADVYPIHAEFSPDGSKIAVGLMYGELLVLDAASGDEVASTWREGAFSGAAFAPDGIHLLSVWSKYALPGETRRDEFSTVLANIRTGQQTDLNFGGPADVTRASFAPDGNKVVIGYEDGTRVLNSESGGLIETLSPHNSGIISAAFSRRGDLISTSYWDGSARIWDADTANLLATLNGHTGNVLWVAIASSGLIATSSSDNSIRIWGASG